MQQALTSSTIFRHCVHDMSFLPRNAAILTWYRGLICYGFVSGSLFVTVSKWLNLLSGF